MPLVGRQRSRMDSFTSRLAERPLKVSMFRHGMCKIVPDGTCRCQSYCRAFSYGLSRSRLVASNLARCMVKPCSRGLHSGGGLPSGINLSSGYRKLSCQARGQAFWDRAAAGSSTTLNAGSCFRQRMQDQTMFRCLLVVACLMQRF